MTIIFGSKRADFFDLLLLGKQDNLNNYQEGRAKLGNEPLSKIDFILSKIEYMNVDQYILSFTGASLSISESTKIAEVYLDLKDWDAVETIVKGENLIQARTQSSLQRTYQELHPRLRGLSDPQLELLVEGNFTEQKQLLWFAVCKRYAYIREFATDVLHEKYLRLDYELTEFDYDAFFNRKADWHPELDQLTGMTQKKIKSRIFRMLLEAGLITEENRILPAILSTRVIEVLASDAPMSYRIFPLSLTEIEDQVSYGKDDG